MTERKAFDTWALSPAPDEWWGLSERERLFLAWQAATTAALERVAEEIKQLDKKHWFSKQSKFAEFLVDAIRALKDES